MSIYTHVRYEYIQYTVLLLPFQQCQTRLSCGDSDYFWDSVAAPCIYGMAACMFLCVTLYYRAGHATTVSLQRVLGDKIASYFFCLYILYQLWLTQFKHLDLNICCIFLVSEALLRCCVVISATLKNCRVLSSRMYLMYFIVFPSI